MVIVQAWNTKLAKFKQYLKKINTVAITIPEIDNNEMIQNNNNNNITVEQ